MTAHELELTSKHCENFSTCWWGICSCGDWTKGPHFFPDTVRAYWHDHIHLVDESECALHGRFGQASA